MRDLLLLGACAFAGAFALRIADPIVLPVAAHFGITAGTAALLATAFALPYALAQPFLGTLGDRFGKARCVRVCVAGLALALIAGLFAPGFDTLLATRALAGVCAGGLVPLVLAGVADRVPLAGRQVAIGRMLFAVISGQMLGSASSGVLEAAFGWLASIAAAAVVASVVAAAAWRALEVEPGRPDDAPPADAAQLWRALFANRKTIWVLGAAFVEGTLVFGVFPHVGSVLVATSGLSAERVPVPAGLVLGAFGVGGVLFAAIVPALLARLGIRRLCSIGSVLIAACFAALAVLPSWPLAASAMGLAGFAFYMLHSSLQTEATELAPAARGIAFACFACTFFAGQGIGPLLVGAGIAAVGPRWTLLAIAVATVLLGRVVVARIIGR